MHRLWRNGKRISVLSKKINTSQRSVDEQPSQPVSIAVAPKLRLSKQLSDEKADSSSLVCFYFIRENRTATGMSWVRWPL